MQKLGALLEGRDGAAHSYLYMFVFFAGDFELLNSPEQILGKGKYQGSHSHCLPPLLFPF